MMAMTPLEGWTAARLGLVGKRVDRRLLESYQLEKLTATIRFATAYSPFYRKHLGRNAAAGLRTLADLTGLPFANASDLRRCGSQMVCVSQSWINRVVTLDTSGTVGDPKRLWFTAEDQTLTVDFFQAGMSILTRPGDRVLILLPGRRPGSVGALLAQALTGMGMTPLTYDWSGNLADAANFFQNERVDSVVGSPIQERIPGVEFTEHLCKRAACEGWSVWLLGGEPGIADKAATSQSESLPAKAIFF